jgi:hypothetical protein
MSAAAEGPGEPAAPILVNRSNAGVLFGFIIAFQQDRLNLSDGF